MQPRRLGDHVAGCGVLLWSGTVLSYSGLPVMSWDVTGTRFRDFIAQRSTTNHCSDALQLSPTKPSCCRMIVPVARRGLCFPQDELKKKDEEIARLKAGRQVVNLGGVAYMEPKYTRVPFASVSLRWSSPLQLPSFLGA